jgi:hypothetical protein
MPSHTPVTPSVAPPPYQIFDDTLGSGEVQLNPNTAAAISAAVDALVEQAPAAMRAGLRQALIGM